MIVSLLALVLAIQDAPAPAPLPSPTASQTQAQADGQAAVEGMVEIFTVLGSCERHFTPDQVRGVRRALEPDPGAAQTPLQAYIDGAYQRGKADTSRSAPFCQEVMRTLAEARSRPQ